MKNKQTIIYVIQIRIDDTFSVEKKFLGRFYTKEELDVIFPEWFYDLDSALFALSEFNKENKIDESVDYLECISCIHYKRNSYFWCSLHDKNSDDYSWCFDWLRKKDLNQRPLGYEPNELPDCSIPRQLKSI